MSKALENESCQIAISISAASTRTCTTNSNCLRQSRL